MRLAPNGIQKRNIKMDGFVVVSLNLGVVRTEEDRIVMIFSPRSSVASLQEDTKERLNTLAETFGFTVSHSSEYPGWSFKEDSPVREICKESYKELFGEDLKIEAIHAGLECGLFLEKYPDLEMVSFGPTLRGVHSPDARLEIATVPKFWDLLCETLRVL